MHMVKALPPTSRYLTIAFKNPLPSLQIKGYMVMKTAVRLTEISQPQDQEGRGKMEAVLRPVGGWLDFLRWSTSCVVP